MNKYLKKAMSLVLVFVLAFGVFAISSSAAASIAVKTNKTEYLQGETVTATVYFPSAINTVASLDMSLTYDSSKLEVVSVTDGKELDAAIKAQVNGRVFSENHSTAGKILWSIAATNNFNFSGTFATVTFNVKSRAAGGKCDLNLKVTNAANSGYVSMTKSLVVESTSFNIAKVAANELSFERTKDGKAYEVVGYPCLTVDNISIPSSYAGLPVIGIADKVFLNHAELKTIVLPDTLQYIGDEAFKGCSGVQTIVIPNSVDTIGAGAFEGCTKLTSLTLPIGLETIEKNTFSGCTYLESVEIPFTVTKIGAGAFKDCYVLSSVKISKRTTNIAADAFKECGTNMVFNTVSGNTYLPTYISANLPGAKINLIKDFSLGTATLSYTTAQYMGSELKPSVTVKLTSGEKVIINRQYKVVYKNNNAVGTAKVYVAGMDEYGEGYILTFSINCAHKNVRKEIGKEPTCTQSGYYNCICEECGNITKETIPAFGHTEGVWVIDKRPTIKETGLKHSECVDCRAVMQKNVVIPKAFPDLNGDKQINSSDALIVLQYATEMKNYLTTQELLYNADTNGDGSINSGDALTILQIAIGQVVIEGYSAA